MYYYPVEKKKNRRNKKKISDSLSFLSPIFLNSWKEKISVIETLEIFCFDVDYENCKLPFEFQDKLKKLTMSIFFFLTKSVFKFKIDN